MASGYPDYEGGKQRVYLVPEWSALKAADKDFFSYAGDMPHGDGPLISYTVPAGKTLYIMQIAWFSCASTIGDYELNQMCSSLIYNATTGTYYMKIGGNAGGSFVLGKPIVVPGGEEIQIYCTNESGHTTDAYITAQGYEV
jgi:hypothetical protein